MISYFGNFLLTLAALSALLQCSLPLMGHFRQKHPYLLAFARPAMLAQIIFIISAYGLLTLAFAVNDFTITYVGMNAHPSLPLMYRLTAVWGGHEGSILLWILLFNLWTLIFFMTSMRFSSDVRTLTIAVLGGISFAFLCFLLFTSNPFLATHLPMNGHDLNPLLQDPGFIIHPPILYTGYAGLAVAFAITESALLCGKLDDAWALLIQRFVIAPWCFLTIGIALGSWWAYRVLGWGGFWFWDPVENASLLPWLAATALFHLLILVAKRQMAPYFAALLAVVCFALSLLGTFLVRSGILISVHSFATDPSRGIFLLLLFGILVFLALLTWVCCLPKRQLLNAASVFSWCSREAGLLLQSALLLIAMVTILFGTLYPLIADALQLGNLSVGAPYFNTVLTPLVGFLLLLMGFNAYSYYQGSASIIRWKQLILSFVMSLCIASGFIIYLANIIDLETILLTALSLWVIAGCWRTRRYLPSMSLAHFGFAILMLGILLSSTLQQEREVRLKPGTAASIGPYQFFFVNTTGIKGPNYRGIRARFDVLKNKYQVATLEPEKRIYLIRDMVMTKVAIHPSIFRDLYIALGEPLNDDDWSVRIYYKPFIRWIWAGAFIMMLGGLWRILSPLTSRRGGST